MKTKTIKTAMAGLLVLLSLLSATGGGGAKVEAANVGEANSAQAGFICTPYGPEQGYQYDPALLMNNLGQKRNANVGPFLSAHRGAWGTDSGLPQPAPENSLIAIDNAAALKFEMIELDVKMTSDNKLVLMHDYTMGRTTNYGEDYNGIDLWDAFKAQTTTGGRPQDKNPPDWEGLALANPLVSEVSSAAATSIDLRLFDKSVGTLGTSKGATAKGTWYSSPNYGKVLGLLETLEYIGETYPGMTVVLDLRHEDEVREAMNVIDQVADCQGTPANKWVILKPFANVFPGGFIHASKPFGSVLGQLDNFDNKSVMQYYGNRALRYKWIPVVSGRLVPPNAPGQPSVIPGSPGPDVSQIMPDVKQYLYDWSLAGSAVVTFENGVYPGSPQNMVDAYNWAQGFTTNMQSWRPPDIDVVTPVIDPSNNNRTIIGFNWKDDGMGAYPVYKETSRGYEDTREYAGAITVEDPVYILNMEKTTRAATQFAISKPVGTAIVPNNSYKLINVKSGRALAVNGLSVPDAAPTFLWDDDNTYSQTWTIAYNSNNGTHRLINAGSANKALSVSDASTEDAARVILWPWSVSDVAQQWKIVYNGDGTYSLKNPHSGKMLDVDYGNTANGTNAIIWPSNNQDNQKWRLVPVANYKITNPASGKVVDIHNQNGVVNGSNIEINSYNGGPDHKWRLISNADGTFQIVSAAFGKALDVASGGTADGTNVQAWQRDLTNANGNQKWKLIYNNSDKTYKLLNPQSMKVLDIENNGTANGSNVHIWTDLNASNQKWKLDLVSTP